MEPLYFVIHPPQLLFSEERAEKFKFQLKVFSLTYSLLISAQVESDL